MNTLLKSLLLKSMTMIVFLVMGSNSDVAVSQSNTEETVLRYVVDEEKLPRGEAIDLANLLTVINERLGELGQAVRVNDKELEIRIIGKPRSEQLQSIRRRVATYGNTEFHYFVDSNEKSNQPIIEQALQIPWDEDVIVDREPLPVKWFPMHSEDVKSNFARKHRLIVRLRDSNAQVLAWLSNPQITGEHLTTAERNIDGLGNPVICLTLNLDGFSNLRVLTKSMKDNAADGEGFLGLFIDRQAFGGTIIKKPLDKDLDLIGLSSGTMDDLLAILNAGILPYQLREVNVK